MCRIPGNSRGDGHLTTSASNSGGACAIAAYKWLEFTAGSDTRSSARKSAVLVGTYGIRLLWRSRARTTRWRRG
jgi:Asp-tRNA(Asn)/Glu-tRNA(Gln) amidotransferase A subunit family amidase